MVIGLAREGLDLTRFLTAHGASVLVTDRKRADQLHDVMAQLAGVDNLVRLAAGVLLVLGAIGSVMYALAPRNKPIFDAARRPPAPRPGPEGGA